MTEDQTHDDPDAVDGSGDEPVRTGMERVDALIDEVSDLAGRPVDEHVAVFETVHDELRRTLDARPDDAG